MPDYLFVFAADLHLQPQAWTDRQDIRDDAYESLTQIADFCCQHVPAALLLGGDIWDNKRPDAGSVLCFMQQCQRITHCGVPIYAVQGDHDYNAETPWFTLAGTVTSLHKRTITLGGYHFTGLDFTPRDQLRAVLQTLPPTDFLLTHQSWSQLQGIGVTDGDATWVEQANILLSGDYHRTELISVNRPGLSPLSVISPGSTCLQAIDEPADKYFIACAITNGAFTFERVPLKTRLKLDLRVNTGQELLTNLSAAFKQQLLDLASTLPARVRKPILRIRYRDDIPQAVKYITDWAGGDISVFLTPISAVTTTTVDTEEPTSNYETLLDAVRSMGIDQDVCDILAGLLRSNDMEVALNDFCA